MPDVWLFALSPGWLGSCERVTAAFDDMRHTLAEAAADLVEHGNAAAVFCDVVEKRGDGEIFIASGFEYQTGHAEKMGNVGHRRALAFLTRMFASCKD
jgi:hypothetical protein